jgi:hypothetical protein
LGPAADTVFFAPFLTATNISEMELASLQVPVYRASVCIRQLLELYGTGSHDTAGAEVYEELELEPHGN